MKNEKLTNKKPEYQTGDKILFKQKDKQEILTLKHIALPKGHDGKAWVIKESPGWLGEEQFRHATDEEVYWLETLDRNKVPGFMLGDVLIKENDTVLILDSKDRINHARILYATGNFQGIYPSMSFKRFPERSEQE